MSTKVAKEANKFLSRFSLWGNVLLGIYNSHIPLEDVPVFHFVYRGNNWEMISTQDYYEYS